MASPGIAVRLVSGETGWVTVTRVGAKAPNLAGAASKTFSRKPVQATWWLVGAENSVGPLVPVPNLIKLLKIKALTDSRC